MTPPLVGRAQLAARLVDTIRSGSGRGVTLVGPAGIGKTALVRYVTQQLMDVVDAAWVSGTTASGDIPLAAFAAYLPPTGTEAGIASLVAVRDAILTTSNDRRRLLVVDDAHALDETSAALVQQLVAQGVGILMTQRSGAPASDTISRLWREQTLERIDVPALDDGAIGELVAATLHGEVDPRSAHEVWRRSSGNPLFARELVLGSNAAGEWSPSPSGWRWDVGTTETPRLTDLLRDRLERLDDRQRTALDHLAFGEPMGIGEFASICTDQTLESLERLDLITAEVDRRRITIRFTHPMHAEVIRRTVSPLRARTIRSTLVESLRATGSRRRDDLMRVATLAVDCGSELERDLLVAAARTAIGTGDRAVAVRLASTAFERSPDFGTGHVLADALYEEGRFDDIRRHWIAWTPMAVEPDERAFVAMHQAISLYYRAGDALAAFTVLDRALDDLAPGPRRDEVAALAATLNVMSGRTAIAREIAEPLLASTDLRVRVQASLATVHGLRAAGLTSEALQIGRRAMAALSSMGPAESFVSSTVFGTGEAAVLLAAGRFDEALGSADQAFAVARPAGEASAEGLSQLSRSEALAMAGRFVDAVAAARHAESAFRRTHHHGFARWATAQRAYVGALADDAPTTTRALADLAAIGPHPARLFEYVEVAARLDDELTRDADSAGREVLGLAAGFRELGDVHAALRCAYELLRHGDVRAADPIITWSASTDAPLHRLMRDHARALAADDHEALAGTAERLATSGAIVFAVRAAEHATLAAERQGDERRANRTRLTATAWRERYQPLTPRPVTGEGTARLEPAGAESPVPLTRREREIALLAAQGLASRAIGDRLFVSPRTVDNHLAKAYVKLGVGSRAELAHVLASA